MSQPSPMGTPVPWDLVANAYAAELIPMFERYATDALRLAAPPPNSRIVDVACGPGTLAFLAAELGHTVDAIDFSPQMIAKLSARAIGNPAVTPRLGDGQALPYADATFAAGFSMFGLMFFPDRAKGFAELRRVIKPGGRAVVGSWLPMDTVPAMAAMFGALRTSMKAMLGDKAPLPGQAVNPLSSEDDCRTEMAAHFADVEVHRVEHVQKHESSDALWASLERTMAPLVLLRQKLGEDVWGTLAANARTAIREVTGDGPISAVLPAYLTVGTAR